MAKVPFPKPSKYSLGLMLFFKIFFYLKIYIKVLFWKKIKNKKFKEKK